MSSAQDWLVEKCPSWCVREHHSGDHPEDRYHCSEASIVPAVVAMEDMIPVTASLQGTDLQVWLGRYMGDPITWVAIEPTERREPRLVLSAESAVTLVQGLGVQLAQEAHGG